MFRWIFLFTFALGAPGVLSSLESLQDDEILNLVRTEKYVVVLFTKKDCPECDALEAALLGIREDLVDSLNAWIVKAVGSQLVRLYDPTKEPALVFFRHGVPLLYDGGPEEDLIAHTFSNSKEPAVRELSDDNFEPLTQAATGATTGDWFIMFYSPECMECQRLQARWEAVGAKLKTRLNVAQMNRASTGSVTARRFRVFNTPSFIFFRLGKMYHYSIPKYDITSLVAFASDWYKNAPAEKVPLPKTPFDDLTQQIADYLRENPWIGKIGSFFAIVVMVFFVIQRLRLKEKKEEEEEEEEKKKEEKPAKSQTKKSK